MLPWLWHRLAAAAPIRPLAWELPYAAGVAQKRKKKKKERKKKKRMMPKELTGGGINKQWIETLAVH